MAADTKDRLASLVGGLFGDTAYSDLTIECDGRKWAVHRAVICPQSDYFKKACDGHFKEASKRHIALQEDSSDAVNAMVQFFYKGDYTEALDQHEDATKLLLHIHVYLIADKYQVSTLQDLARSKFNDRARSMPKTLSSNLNDLWDMASIVDELKHDGLVVILKHIDASSPDFGYIVEQIWKLEDVAPGLKASARDLMMKHPQALTEGKHGLIPLVLRIPELAAEVIYWMAAARAGQYYRCADGGCGKPMRVVTDVEVGYYGRTFTCSHCGVRHPELNLRGRKI
ncbi:Putative BTB/POZ domain-containing protein [Septoria linicola]|uniref:BTB/POZ domain-containing protein n=1 Tax=Septoria linicola TaxID=215465 RepID=A0A9Q9EIH8_9PEZI|nr:putative BTB/POZ domain-containing protein [Septoria linicola]USW52050.1 Putative BTB/POZ domain-containing protein [Septoria linicola]